MKEFERILGAQKCPSERQALQHCLPFVVRQANGADLNTIKEALDVCPVGPAINDAAKIGRTFDNRFGDPATIVFTEAPVLLNPPLLLPNLPSAFGFGYARQLRPRLGRHQARISEYPVKVGDGPCYEPDNSLLRA